MTSKLLILHDSPDFGGHERMLIKLLAGVVGSGRFDTTFCLPEANQRLAERLADELPAIRLLRWPFSKKRGEPYLRRFRWRYRRAVRDLVAAEQPDLVLLAQGRIENLAVPLSALPRESRIVSYLPMAHRLPEMHRSGMIGDRLRRALYRRPNHFIVPSKAVADQVRNAGGMAPIAVVANVVDPPRPSPKSEARGILGLPDDRRIALFLGRLDPLQKGIDRLIAAMLREGRGRLSNWTFLFVGDGPGAALIESAGKIGGLDIRLVPWTDRPDLYLSAADIMLAPSRWEGLPLVMLEAMHYRLPVLASDIDVYRDHLPASALANFDTLDLAEALDRATQPAAVECFARHAADRLQSANLEASRALFADALTESLAA